MADGIAHGKTARVTIRTVATDAGVSVAAVSKVIRNAYGVSDALRHKVEASIQRLGYRPSVAARGMRGQTMTLGVLLVGIDNPFLPEIFQGIQSVADMSGYKIMVGVGAARQQTEARLIEQMIDNRMDGLILVASQISGATMDRYARQIPIVVVGHHEPTAANFDTINNDDREGAGIVVRELAARGYRDIGMIALQYQGQNLENVSPQREIGYREAMTEAGLSEHIRVTYAPQPEDPRDRYLRSILTAPDRPRALFCWSDLDAIPLLDMAHVLGLRIPQDLAVVGYDNSPVAGLALINLSSVDQAGVRMGTYAAQALLSRMGGRKVAEHILIEPRLVIRGSI